MCTSIFFLIYTGKTGENGGNSIGSCSKVVLDLMSGFVNSGSSIGSCSKVVLDLMSGFMNSGSSIGSCSKGVLDLMSGLENSGNSIGSCSKVVLDLMSGLVNNGFHLYADDYYTSPTPYHHLYNHGINACGTARPNSGFPKEIDYKDHQVVGLWTTAPMGHFLLPFGSINIQFTFYPLCI